MSSRFWNTLLFVVLGLLLMRVFFTHKGEDKGSLASRADISGQMFKAPASVLETQLLNKEIDFDDASIDKNRSDIQISTALCDYLFSTGGGVLSRVSFKKHLGKDGLPLSTLYPRGLSEREQGCFLIALDAKTPYAYQYIGTECDQAGGYHITFEAQTTDWVIRKVYAVNDNDYSLKLTCFFKPRVTNAAAIQPRIFFSAPFLADFGGDLVEGFVSDLDQKSINKLGSVQEGDFGWKFPAIFGADDKYFVHAFFGADSTSFVQRAYLKRAGIGDLSCILEGPSLTEAVQLSLSFYIGPKSAVSLTAVDPRLVNVLSFGWLSSICRLLIRLLEIIFSLVGNFGWAILLLALLVKLLFLPLTIYAGWRSALYAAFEKRHGGEITSILIRHKNDAIKRADELNRIHSQHGVSQLWKTMGFIAGLPRVPIIFALYRILSSYIGLYRAPFIGWITDLSVQDPYYLLPAVFAVSLFLKAGQAPATDIRAKLFSYALPLLFVGFMASFPAGLVLFVAADGVASIVEDWFIKRLF